MGKRIICGCVVLGIVACLIGCQKSDNYELMKESKQQVLPIYEKKDAEVQGEKCALETLQDVYKSDYILEEWKIEKIGEPGGIFCNDEAVLISDKKTDCIFEVDYAGNILKEVGGTGSGEGEFISPSAITMCNEKQGMTIVMVTHDTSLAKYGTRVVRVEDGRIIEKGKEILK